MWEFTKWSLLVVVVAIVVVGLIAVSTGLLQIPFLYIQTQVIHHSVGYVESRNAHMRDLITQYERDRLDIETKYKDNPQIISDIERHMDSLLADIRATASELEPSEVARDVAEFLRDHQG